MNSMPWLVQTRAASTRMHGGRFHGGRKVSWNGVYFRGSVPSRMPGRLNPTPPWGTSVSGDVLLTLATVELRDGLGVSQFGIRKRSSSSSSSSKREEREKSGADEGGREWIASSIPIGCTAAGLRPAAISTSPFGVTAAGVRPASTSASPIGCAAAGLSPDRRIALNSLECNYMWGGAYACAWGRRAT